MARRTNDYRTPSQNRRDDDDDTDDGNNHRHDDENPPKNDSRNDQGTTTNDNDTTNLLFSCQCDSARQIATLLSCLRRVVTSSSSSTLGGGGGTNDYYTSSTQRNTTTQTNLASSNNNSRLQHATVYAGPSGLTFHVQHGLAKQAQCSVDMPSSLFRHYIVGEEEVWLEDEEEEDNENNDDNDKDNNTNPKYTKEIVQGGEFGINLTTVLECFAILSKKTGNHNSNYTNTNKNYKVQPPSSGSVDHASGASGGGVGGASIGGGGEYASLTNVPLCMSYDRGSATFHLEFLDKGGGSGGGCLVTCEVPGVAVADDDVDDTGHDSTNNNNDDNEEEKGNNEYCNSSSSGLAMAFRASPLISRAILHSDALLSAVSELYDVPGASVVEISLTPTGLGFGCVGPRSEVWVTVPYHRGQGGLYVGLECYALPNNISPDDIGRSSSSRDGGNNSSNIVRRYPLGAFLSGMRGLDIGIETCISVNSRGMMAIQHQVSKEGYYHDLSEGSTPARPSFVDFIMTCIEVVDEDHERGDNQPRPTHEPRSRHDNGLQDITNNDSEDLGGAGRNARNARYRENGTRAATTTTIDERVVMSSDEEAKDTANDFPIKKTRRKETRHDDDDDGNDDRDFGGLNEEALFDGLDCSLGEKAEIIGNDNMSSSNKSEPLTDLVGRKKALDDIRRRRQERHQQEQQTPPVQHYNPTQTQSDDDDGDTTEPEDSLDATAEVPNLFSKRSSLLTSARTGGGKRRKNMTNDIYNSDNDESDMEQQPKMMYGDTKLEFTQDGYSD